MPSLQNCYEEYGEKYVRRSSYLSLSLQQCRYSKLQKRSVFILLCVSSPLRVPHLICHTAVMVVSLISDLSVLLNVEALDSNKSDEVSIILHFLNNC